MNKKVLVIALVSVSMLLIASLGYIIYTDLISENDQEIEEVNKEESKDSLTDETRRENEEILSDEESGEEKNEEITKVAADTDYELQLGDNKSVTIPTSWDVHKVVVESSEPPNKVKEDYALEGVWSIHQGTELVLKKDNSEIHLIERSFNKFYGNIGFECKNFTLEDWIILKEPKNKDDYGVARQKEDDKWIYEAYLLGGCSENNDYQYRDITGQVLVYMTGNENNLEEADRIIVGLLKEAGVFGGELYSKELR